MTGRTTTPFIPRDRIAVAHTAADLAATASAWVVDGLRATLARQPRAVWLATAGRTPVPTYRHLVRRHRQALDWGRVVVLQMDDCPSLPPELSFAAQLRRELVEPLGARAHLMRGPQGEFDPSAYLAALPEIDVALHGIGRNGHVGFNEPGSDIAEWGEVRLARTTCEDMGVDMAATGFTLGLGRLARARRSLLVATGPSKRLAISRLLDTDAHCPASRLWPSGLSVLVDRQAAPHDLTVAKQLAARTPEPA